MSTETKPKIDLAAIRTRAAAASGGPWFWTGDDIYRGPYLAHRSVRGHGVSVVMDFGRLGMQQAEPKFFRDGEDDRLIRAREIPIYQVAPDATSAADPRVYRRDLIGLRHPNAAFIAAARQDVEDLLAYIDHLEAQLAQCDGGAR